MKIKAKCKLIKCKIDLNELKKNVILNKKAKIFALLCAIKSNVILFAFNHIFLQDPLYMWNKKIIFLNFFRLIRFFFSLNNIEIFLFVYIISI